MITSISGEILIESRQSPLGIYELWRKSAQYTQTHLFLFLENFRSALKKPSIWIRCTQSVAEIFVENQNRHEEDIALKLIWRSIILESTRWKAILLTCTTWEKRNQIFITCMECKKRAANESRSQITHKSCRKRRITIKCSIKNHKSRPNAIFLELSFRNTKRRDFCFSVFFSKLIKINCMLKGEHI